MTAAPESLPFRMIASSASDLTRATDIFQAVIRGGTVMSWNETWFLSGCHYCSWNVLSLASFSTSPWWYMVHVRLCPSYLLTAEAARLQVLWFLCFLNVCCHLVYWQLRQHGCRCCGFYVFLMFVAILFIDSWGSKVAGVVVSMYS